MLNVILRNKPNSFFVSFYCIERRIDLFIAVYMNIIKQVSEILPFDDLMKEVNKRMVKSEKFQVLEFNECVLELERRGRIMYDKDEKVICWI